MIGVSASTVEEALTACDQGADYLGIGAVFSTTTYMSLPSIPLITTISLTHPVNLTPRASSAPQASARSSPPSPHHRTHQP
ncbi:thiamine phosphate synthase [Candidatus Bathyarchaeota archaeon]|nr:thiamine phosphate synthase [Candidatus Bathyarchaeota archaeon]